MSWEIEASVDELLDSAVRLGENMSQRRIAYGGSPLPYAHRACTAYHAIESIRWLQQKLAEAYEKLAELQPPNKEIK
jgi:hypothetical protein